MDDTTNGQPQRRRHRAKASAPRAATAAAEATVTRHDNVLSPEVLAAISAATAAAVSKVFDQQGGPRRVVPPPRAGHPAPTAPDDDEDFDPLNPKVQAAARERLAVGRPDARMPSAHGLSDDEVLEMFQQEELGEFDVPKELIPDGWAFGWKLKAALGKEDGSYEAELRRRSWVPVLYEDHPGAFGLKDETGPVIRKGLQLMRRPAEMEELRQRYQRLLAKQAVRDKIAQMSQAPAGTGPRTHKQVAPKVTRTYERLPLEVE